MSRSADGADTSVPLFELRGVSREYEDPNAGLHSIDLRISRGEFVAITGPSGAGKSTLLNVLGLLDHPTGGSYRFDGVETTTASEKIRNRIRRDAIGFVFQASHVLPHLAAVTNTALALRLQGVPARERRERANQTLEAVGLGHRLTARTSVLSGGERQRLAIARAVSTQPLVVLADEPTGSLDTANSDRVMDDLRRLHAAGTTLVVITHDPRVAELAQRRVGIRDGRVVSDSGPTRQAAVPARALPVSEDAPTVIGRKTKHKARGKRRLAGWADTLGEAASEMVHRPLRTLLLVLAFAAGVGGLVLAGGLSLTAASQVSVRLTETAKDEVIIAVPGGGELLRPANGQLRTWRQALTGIEHVQSVGVYASAPAASAHVRRLSPDDLEPSGTLQLVSVDPAYAQEEGIVTAGDGTSAVVWGSGMPAVAYLGPDAARVLATSSPGPGSSIWIGSREVSVIGSAKTLGRAPSLSNAVFVSPDVLVGEPGTSISLVLRTEPGYPAAVADVAARVLDPVHPERFDVETAADLRSLRMGVATDLDAFVGAMSTVLLLLATISASTSMYLSVHSRAGEIALRRALGAPRSHVADLFLSEGGLIGLIGGVVGGLAGVIGVVLVSSGQGWEATIQPSATWIGLPLGVVTGIVAAIIPALTAARQDPVQHL